MLIPVELFLLIAYYEYKRNLMAERVEEEQHEWEKGGEIPGVLGYKLIKLWG